MPDTAMVGQLPEFSPEAIADISRSFFGIEGTITPLVSWENQNARIQSKKGSYLIKIANSRFSAEALQMQIDVLAYLKNRASDLAFPHVIRSKNGKDIEIIDGFAVRVFNFLEGETLGNVARSPRLYRNIGRFLGRFSTAMAGYDHLSAHKPGDIWSLDNVMACMGYLDDVHSADCRERIKRFYELYEVKTLPKLNHLRKSVIHNDVNEHNLLVNPEHSDQVSGLIDFDEIQYGTHINELAIAVAYALLGEDDFDKAAGQLIGGYTEFFSLKDEEMAVLPNLVAMRLIQSIILASNHAKKNPGNDYILISQKPARELLSRIENEGFSF